MKIVTAQVYPAIVSDQARAIGTQLQELRQKSGKNPEEVADKLLLSKQQVLGLEAGELKFFYGSKLYAQAADKYAAFLELDTRPSDHLFGVKESGDPTAIEAPAEALATTLLVATVETHSETASEDIPPPIAANGDIARPMIRRIVIAAALFAVVIVWLTLYQEQPAAIQPASSLITPMHTTQSVQPATPTPLPPAPVSKEDALPSGSIRLEFSGHSWVQSVSNNGQKQERTYRDGESLILEPANLQALIIGNASVVSVNSPTGEIRLTPYLSNGSQVARLIGLQIRQLATKNGRD